MPANIVVLQFKLFNHLLNPIIAVVIIDKPSFNPEPSMVHDPLLERRGLIPQHSTCTKLVLPLISPPLLIGFRIVNPRNRRHHNTINQSLRIGIYSVMDKCNSNPQSLVRILS
ncbi:hypothetical protein CFOL_v3_29458 [Cephalotus follicularis]|uniref:Uncharacterized protein n=1 Tax=Cephalotus follicularis TaxID=3775 RepID=A0A1Q3D0P9_CEPFO|nr:hypothetical protein CFOL_v3_29458 [Cephalotus follicularis]